MNDKEGHNLDLLSQRTFHQEIRTPYDDADQEQGIADLPLSGHSRSRLFGGTSNGAPPQHYPTNDASKVDN